MARAFHTFPPAPRKYGHDQDPLANKNTLQKEVAAFKKTSRKVFMLACPAENEWAIKPSTTRKNRLRSIAVANKHASIRGISDGG